jgi:hypothetical protein
MRLRLQLMRHIYLARAHLPRMVKLPSGPPQKCPRKSIVSMIVLKLSAMKGNLECFPFSVLVVENAFLNLCRF